MNEGYQPMLLRGLAVEGETRCLAGHNRLVLCAKLRQTCTRRSAAEFIPTISFVNSHIFCFSSTNAKTFRLDLHAGACIECLGSLLLHGIIMLTYSAPLVAISYSSLVVWH